MFEWLYDCVSCVVCVCVLALGCGVVVLVSSCVNVSMWCRRVVLSCCRVCVLFGLLC